MPETAVGNDGNNGNNKPLVGFGPQIVQEKPPGRAQQSSRIGMDTFHSLLQGQQSGHLAKDLIHPGKDVVEMLMRTFLLDVNEARDVALTLAKCDEFEMEEEKRLILYLLAARTSVHGRGRLEYLQGMTGILAMPWFGYKGKGYDNRNRGNGAEEPR